MSVSAASGAPDRSSPGRADAVTAAPPGAESPLAYLDSLANFERTGQLTSPTMSRVAALVAELGHPERSYPVIHVTGTNGKGSTTAMIAGLLASRGARVGTYTSPHLDRLAERITISGQPVEDRELAEGFGQVAAAALRSGVTPTWFEAVTASAFWLLAARQVDAAVIEVGMLGRWDATNVVNGSVSVITNVQLDHTDVAGPTRASIASEKAGIVKPGSTLILGERDPELRPLFEAERPGKILTLGSEMSWRNRTATESGSIVDLVDPWGARDGIRVGMLGSHQCDNALLALTAAEAFSGTPISAAAVDSVLSGIQVPGRLEVVRHSPAVVLDGAHNPAGAAALGQAMREAFTRHHPKVLLWGSLAGRDPMTFLEQLGAGDFDFVVATQPRSPRALPAGLLGRAARSLGLPGATDPDPRRALEQAMHVAGTDGVVLATGSLYLVGLLRAMTHGSLPAAGRREKPLVPSVSGSVTGRARA